MLCKKTVFILEANILWLHQRSQDFWACRNQTQAQNQNSYTLSEGLGSQLSMSLFPTGLKSKQPACLGHDVLISIPITLLDATHYKHVSGVVPSAEGGQGAGTVRGLALDLTASWLTGLGQHLTL